MTRLLIADDNAAIREILTIAANAAGFDTVPAIDGADAWQKFSSENIDLILLDVMLPKMDGFAVASELRKNKIDTPILMLTAKDQVADKVKGLDAGADDYMTKPFAPEELLARVRALTRRQGEVVIDELTFGDLTLNLATCDLICGAKSVHLNFKEFEIMKILMQNPNAVTTKDDLIVKVWGYDSNAVDNNVEVYISFLRKKIEFVSSAAQISSLRKIGYRLEVGRT